MRDRRYSRLLTILSRGQIKSDDECRLVNGFVADMESARLSDDNRAKANAFAAGLRAARVGDGSLVSVKVRELLALIESDGWVLVRTKGSHRQFQHPTKPGTVTIAGNLGVDVPAGTLNSVLKQAGLKK